MNGAVILIERQTDLMACVGHAMRMRALASLLEPGHVEANATSAQGDSMAITLADGTSVVADHVDLGGGGTLSVRANLRRYGFGQASFILNGPDRPRRTPIGRIDVADAIRAAAAVSQSIIDTANEVALDPIGRSTGQSEDATGLRGFSTAGAADGGMLPSVTAALIAREAMRLGFPGEVLWGTTVVTTIRPNGTPYVSLRFDTSLSIPDVPALTPEGQSFLRAMTRPSMSLSLSPEGTTMEVKPVRTMPVALDHADDPMLGLRAEARLHDMGTAPTGILTDGAFRALRSIHERRGR
jgi:hypothetical protein